MKKFLAPILACLITASISVNALAATPLTSSPSTGNGAGDYSIGVNGKYAEGSQAETKISVDIVWDSMEFTYNADAEYDTSTHKTTVTGGSWNTDKKTITITNHSNTEINANFNFTQGTDVTTIGTFYELGSAENTYTPISKITLMSGEDNTTEGQIYTTPQSTVYFGISGDGIDSDKALGTITVKIEQASD